MTPETVHYERAAQFQTIRTVARTTAYGAHPERFVKGPPLPWPLPTAAWINRPEIRTTTREVMGNESLISLREVSQRG